MSSWMTIIYLCYFKFKLPNVTNSGAKLYFGGPTSEGEESSEKKIILTVFYNHFKN